MRSSNKMRSRNKNNNRRNNPANVVNRVFDSSGPEGKVRGTPQQIIDKYLGLAQDSMLSGDRVNSENFLQHAEHYSRMLSEAQREMNERRDAQEAQRQQKQQKPRTAEDNDAQPEIKGDTAELFPAQANQNVNLVETPESKVTPIKIKKSKPKPKPKETAESPENNAVELDTKTAENDDKPAN